MASNKSCKGIHDRFKAVKHNNGGLYIQGFKRCNECEVYFKTSEIKCRCCQNFLRSKPRNGRYKEQFRKYVEEKVEEVIS